MSPNYTNTNQGTAVEHLFANSIKVNNDAFEVIKRT